MTILEAATKLTELQHQMHAYSHAMGVLSLDASTAAPKDTAKGRNETFAVLSAASYALFANPEVGELLAFLNAHRNELTPQQARETEILTRDYEQRSKVPQEEYVAFGRLANEADQVWRAAKKNNDYASFQPYLGRIVTSCKQMANYYKPGENPYNVWLDKHERGMTVEKLDKFFATLRETIVPLVHRIQTEAEPIRDDFLHGEFPVWKQRIFSDFLMEVLGVDRSHCGIAETEHPFTTGFNKYDARITTHYYPNDMASSMYSVVHESGHAIYEMHTDDKLMFTCLEGGTSMGIHESQSRLFENMIGRSEAFVELIFPKVQELFPENFAGVNAHEFYRAINQCKPSLIRIYADELTYCLHIMVRYEAEKKLFSGEVDTKEIPALWASLMKEYLGVDVTDDTNGVLQDVHWSGAEMGYFPSYAIGTAYAAQMVHKMREDLDVDAAVRAGDLSSIVGWLTERVYRFGRSKDPDNIILDCCGEPFDPKYYTDYLTEKFSAIYNLK